ncbi:nuclear mitotic apparatus protein 1 [Dorcoceras hygrometricum]|uniref:Nuclear mitotic apparatus protein 1 n=1 Tax=Dorcoceras hygrometricum TaxID=472368 RepID=A0A2Z7ANC5_9LAMI|nr:nuclear mitotic apparatus protein 1 [Dorcoceras hygrometricum]
MDKNKSRTDLLAAGRKKLEKFRQKKDNKGSNSKSVSKATEAGRSAHDASVDAASEVAVTPQNLSDVEKSNHDTQVNSALSDSDVRWNLVGNDNISSTDELSGKAIIIDEASPAMTSEMQSEDSVNKTRFNQSAVDGCDIDSEILQTGRSSSVAPEDANNHVSHNPNVFPPREHSPDSGIPIPADFTSQLERPKAEEQEVVCSSENQIDGGMAVQIERHNDISPNECAQDAEKAAPLIEPDIISLAVATNNNAKEAQQGDDRSVGSHHLIESEIVSALRAEVSSLVGEDVKSGLLDEKEKETLDVSGVYGGDQVIQVNPEVIEERCLDSQSNGTEREMFEVSYVYGCGQGAQVNPEVTEERSVDSKNYGTAISRGCTLVDLPSGLDGGLIKLSQLAEILQMLDKDDFKFLFMSISPEKLRHASNIAVQDPAVHDTVERLKQELYVASFVRDAFHLQLSEHQKLIDQDFLSNALLTEIQGKNEILEEGIVRCRDELLNVASERKEPQKTLQFSNTEVEAVSDKANELQDKLEMAQRDMSSLSTELVDCRNLIASLQAETDSYKKQIEMMHKETKKLLGDRENILLEKNNIMGQLAECKASLGSLQSENVKLAENVAMLGDGTRQLYEEKDYLMYEKNTLLADLKEQKRTLESLEAENKNSHEILRSLSEERKKLEEERELLVLQNANLLKELTKCNDLLPILQAEISNLQGNLTSATEVKNKYEEERESILSQYEKQWHEFMEIKVLEAGLKSQCSKVMDDLKKARVETNNLTKENENLKANIEFHKSNTRDFGQERGFEEVANDNIGTEVLTIKKFGPVCHLDKSSMEHMKLNFYDDSYRFMALKKRLEDAGDVLRDIEKAIEDMQLHAASLSRSNDKIVAPGVSRLIQAFESKNQIDDQSVEPSSPEDQETGDPYRMTKNVVQTLGALIKELILDAKNATEVFVGVRKSKLHAVTNLMSNYDYLRIHTDLVEEAVVEHMVVCEVMREHAFHAVAKESDLLIQCGVLQKQELIFKSENSQLWEKLNDFQTKTSELQNKLDAFYRDSEDIADSISHEIKIYQTELVDRGTILEDEWKSVIAQVLLAVGELDSTIKTFDSASVDGANSELNVVSHISTSALGAIKVIKDLNQQLEAADKDRQAASSAYDDLLEKWSNLQGKYEMAVVALHRLYSDLSVLVSGEIEENVKDDKSLDILHPDVFSVLLDQLKRSCAERLQLESANQQLYSELMSCASVIDVLEKKYDKLNTLIELFEDIEQSVVPEGTKNYADEPIARLEGMICLLVQKYKEAEQSLSLSSSLEVQLICVQGQVENLNFALVQYENENLIFKQSLKSAEDHIVALNSKVQEMIAELEQSEHRVSSLREKLGIAVTKGKGLIFQRDSLKQSLAETSKELDKCSQELITKDTILHDLETKLKVYSEAGERMEALESELSYIRNSSTALRESFLLKDSVLQRIEEVLEDLELPEHFHARDIIEKIDWLAKSVTGNAAHLGEWDQRSSMGGGSYSDTAFVGADGLKDEMQLTLNSSDDLRRRYEELQSKFYDLAEQNEMLEQSLMQRNKLLQQWEEVFDRIDMPSQIRSMDTEDKIQWFERVLTEAQSRCNSLQQKIDDLESHCGSLTANMQDSDRRISELDAAFQQACREKEILSRDLELLSQEYTELSKKTFDFEIRNVNLQNEVSMLQDQKLLMEKEIHHFESVMSRMQDLVKDALWDSNSEDLTDGQEEIKSFEELLSKLVQKYLIMLSGNPVKSENIDVHVTEKGEMFRISSNPDDQEVAILSKKLDDLMGELDCLKDEKDRYVLKNESLLRDVEELQSNKNDLRELLNQEEHKSASLREKLNVAVRKGKSLVQQRDSMKQVIEELNTEVRHLKSETNQYENTISEYGARLNELPTLLERVRIVESENSLLMGRLAETESCLQVKEDTLSHVLDALCDVDIGLTIDSLNPIEKIKEIETNFHDMRTSLNFAEQESRKSKRAAELLLAELNEVQERSDILQEELEKVADELSKISKEKESAQGAKYEALARVEKLSSLLQEKDRRLSEVMVLNSGVDQVREDLFAFENVLGDVLSKDRKVLHDAANIMKYVFESGSAFDLSAEFPLGTTDGKVSYESENKSFLTEIGSLNEQLHKHSLMLHEEICYLSEVTRNIQREFVSQKELTVSISRDVTQLESKAKESESEVQTLHGNVSLLYDACVGAIFEIEKWKDLVDGKFLASVGAERNLKSQSFVGEYHITNVIPLYTTEGIRSICDKLLSAVRDCTSMQTELNEVGQREMKNTIVNLQKELQERDIQREKICKELVHQIKEAETNAKNYLQDLQQATAQLYDLQRQVDAKEDECRVLEQRLEKLQDQESNYSDLQKKLNSLTNTLAAKEQEVEALIQALDEEESQMEDLVNKIRDLENELKVKNQGLESLEASRTKTLKKLSVTVSKFDELHSLSENLLSEVENLQSQLQERDGEISFLRQEVTRCTNDALNVTHMSKKNSDEIHDSLTWLDMLISPEKSHDGASDDNKSYQVDEYKEVLRKKIMALILELENLRLMVKNSDILLQEERSKVDELAQNQLYLEHSLRDKESVIAMLQGAGGSVKPTSSTSEIVEVESITNKRASPRTIAPQVRSLRKTNNDQVAISIDMDHSDDRLQLDDDDDKAHGFKSLTTSKIVPRFTRPVSDMIDGLWSSIQGRPGGRR